jgi:hypothetical protein
LKSVESLSPEPLSRKDASFFRNGFMHSGAVKTAFPCPGISANRLIARQARQD